MENRLITVFTPTFNRSRLLKNIYKSLCLQSDKLFEWLIVDDGSMDDTEDVIKEFSQENKVIIRYFKQTNKGKHYAINKGVREAKGKIFFIVDSDDSLFYDSLATIRTYFEKIQDDKNFAGVAGIMAYPDGKIIGSGLPKKEMEVTALDIRMKYHVQGDLSEVFKTEVLKDFPFPEFENEKFCPEALVWFRIAQKYKFLYFNKTIYIRDYLEGGLTSKIVRIRKNSPNATLLYYSELKKYHIPFRQKIKAAINYWRFSFCSKISFSKKIKQIGIIYILLYPLGFLYYLLDSKR